jgi:hypothetical protein
MLKVTKHIANKSCTNSCPLSGILISHMLVHKDTKTLPTAAARVRSKVKSCRIVADKVELGQVFTECFGFPCQFSFHRLLHGHLSPGACTVGQIVAGVSSGLSLTPPQGKKYFLNTVTMPSNDPRTPSFKSLSIHR